MLKKKAETHSYPEGLFYFSQASLLISQFLSAIFFLSLQLVTRIYRYKDGFTNVANITRDSQFFS